MSRATDFDPWALLGIPRSYEVSPATVEVAHLRRMAVLHPDRIADPVRREEAAREVAALNEARTVLLDDEQRADCLLALVGGASKEDDRSLPEGYLMEVMELREALEDAASSGDPDARAAVEAQAAQRRSAHRAEVSRLFAEALASPDAETLRRVRLELNAWRYVERLRQALET